MLPNSKGFVKHFQDFKLPTLSLPISILPNLLQPSDLLSFFLPFTKDYSFSFYPKRLSKQDLWRFEFKIMFRKKKPKWFDFALLKRRKEDPHLVSNGMRRIRFVCSKGNGRKKRRFLCSEANGRKRKRFLCSEANGRKRKKFLCSEANGRRRKRFFFNSSHFSPKQLYLDLCFFPLILRFYFTMVLGHYLHISPLSLGL